MISINPLATSKPTLKTFVTPKPKVSKPHDKSGLLNKSLLALAMLGLATMSSCSKDDYLGDILEEPPKKENAASTVESRGTSNINTTSYAKTSKILETLGILNNEQDSLKNVKTISCRDNEGSRYCMAARNISDNYITGKGIKILSNDSPSEIYNFTIKNSAEDSVDFIKMYDSGETEILNYVLGKDNSVIEYKILDGNYKLENSVYRMVDDGVIEQTCADGTTKTYNSIALNEPYPTAITFGATVDDYVDVNVNI